MTEHVISNHIRFYLVLYMMAVNMLCVHHCSVYQLGLVVQRRVSNRNYFTVVVYMKKWRLQDKIAIRVMYNEC